METGAETKARQVWRLAGDSLLVGLCAGAAANAYRLALQAAKRLPLFALSFADGRPLWAAGWFILLAVMAFAVGWLLRWEAKILGGGTAHVAEELAGITDAKWWKVLFAKMAAGVICGAGGLSLGREGPSVQLGAMAGKGAAAMLKKRPREHRRLLIACGAGAGLAAAFNAPLTGIVFVIEGLHKKVSPQILCTVLVAEMSADFLSKLVFGTEPILPLQLGQMLELRAYWILPVLGVVCALFGSFYKWAAVSSNRLLASFDGVPAEMRPTAAFLLSGAAGFFAPELLGDGHALAETLSMGGITLRWILFLLPAKLLFTAFCSASGAPGGVYFPVLVIGGLIGAAAFAPAAAMLGLSQSMLPNFIVLAMAGFFAAVVEAPLTGMLLVCEMAGSFPHMLSMAIVSAAAYVTSLALDGKR